MVAATATSGSPFEFHSRIWSLEPVLGQRQDGYVETLGLVVAEKLRGKKSAMLGLGIPIELQANGREAIRRSCLLSATACEGECTCKE
jgi:hypothetical protein